MNLDCRSHDYLFNFEAHSHMSICSVKDNCASALEGFKTFSPVGAIVSILDSFPSTLYFIVPVVFEDKMNRAHSLVLQSLT
jgi:hypothetical protein